MNEEDVYGMVYDAVRQALRDEAGGSDLAIARRMEEGKVVFEDGDGRRFKEIDVFSVFRKVTAVREKLRVLEQKLNNHEGLSGADKAELQALVSRCYGSLTTFNFLFANEADKFRGTGG